EIPVGRGTGARGVSDFRREQTRRANRSEDLVRLGVGPDKTLLAQPVYTAAAASANKTIERGMPCRCRDDRSSEPAPRLSRPAFGLLRHGDEPRISGEQLAATRA